MKDLINKGLALGLGLAVVSKEQIEKLVDELVKKGEVSAGESKDLIRELFEKGETEKKEMNTRIHEQMEKLLKEFNIPTKADLERLEQRILDLENK
ncbi:MAG: polyhydroxyalkanoate synthesis regulator [Desulfosporosinus sp.]|nr:polyhydroxyalkanoate synthesis regulator [Desulfosporosinus sp.]